MGDQGPRHGLSTIDAKIHNVVMMLTPQERAGSGHRQRSGADTDDPATSGRERRSI
jgi:hypothetical protein